MITEIILGIVVAKLLLEPLITVAYDKKLTALEAKLSSLQPVELKQLQDEISKIKDRLGTLSLAAGIKKDSLK